MLFLLAVAIVAFLASRVIFPREIAEAKREKAALAVRPDFDVPLDDLPDSGQTRTEEPELHPAVDADGHNIDLHPAVDADRFASEPKNGENNG